MMFPTKEVSGPERLVVELVWYPLSTRLSLQGHLEMVWAESVANGA